MRDAIRADQPRHVTTDKPALVPPSHSVDLPDLRLPKSKWDSAPIWIAVVYGLAFLAPIGFSTKYTAGFVLFVCGLLCAVQAQGWIAVCWLANPLFWIGLSLICSRQRSRRILGGWFGACAVMAASILVLLTNSLALVGPAYLLWGGSFVLLAVTGLIGGTSPVPIDPPAQWSRAMDDEN
jgi:hypothetical protein